MSQGQPGDFSLRLPRPGSAVKLVLGLVAVMAVVGAVYGEKVFVWLALGPDDFVSAIHHPHVPHVWALVTSGVMTAPNLTHPILSLIALYFTCVTLERKWGGKRLLWFLAIATVIGNLFVLAAAFALPRGWAQFHPEITLGPLAAISGAAVAWAKENQAGRASFFGLFPMTGRTFLWISLGFAVLMLISPGTTEGCAAPLGGVLAGFLFAGSPSPARGLWLRLRLGALRRQGGGGGITVSDLLDETPRTRPSVPKARASSKSPALRIVQGGLDDDLKNRKPPKDKRYLN